MKALLTSFLLVIGLGGEAMAQEPAELFVDANQAYEQGDYSQAIAGYEQLLTQGTAGSGVHYNLGNAYLRNGELGRAIAQLRRSRNLSPRDGDIRANLAFARQTTRDANAPPEPSPVLSTLLFWHYGLSRAELAATLVVVNILFWGVAAVRLYRRDSEVLRWVSIGLLVLLVAVAGSVAAHRWIDRPVAVIVPQEIDTFAAPDSDSVVRFKLHAGTEVPIKDAREGWWRIALPDGQQAWIERQWTEVVDR